MRFDYPQQAANGKRSDKTADTCKDYTPNGKAPWYEKYMRKGEKV